jgi:hypothetical protein
VTRAEQRQRANDIYRQTYDAVVKALESFCLPTHMVDEVAGEAGKLAVGQTLDPRDFDD